MDFDLDDIFSDGAANKARVVGKFQPKAKPKPKVQPRNKSASLPSTQSVPVTISNSEVFGTTEQEQLQNTHNQSSPKINGDLRSGFDKSEGENADLYLGLDDFLPQFTTVTETPTVHDSDHGNAEKGPVDPDLGNNGNASTHLESPAQLVHLTGEGAAIFGGNGDFQIENITMGTEDAENFPCLETLDIMSESITSTGPRIGKFQPKPKLQNRKGEQSTIVPNPEAIESVLRQEDIQSVPLETEYMHDDSIPSFPTNDVLDFSSVRVDNSSDFHVNEESTNLTETSQIDAAIPAQQSEAVPEMPLRACESTKRRKRKVPQASGISPHHQKASTSIMEDQTGRSSRRSKKRADTFQLSDESEDDSLDEDYVLENEDNDNNDEHVLENELLNQRKRSKSKKPVGEKEKPVGEKEKPVRKRKKANDVAAESTKATTKKFSHRTRRNKRRVNPDLLKIPEDEIDLRNLVMKDIILLAEYREKMAKSEVTTSEAPTINKSASSFSTYNDEDEAFTSTHDSGFPDEDENSIEPDDSTYYNYRTHMKIKPRMRWTKQDTELFYEAVQQFGTDLSMITERFPGRTREQIKSKFKKEERQQPSRLHDALTTRAKDHSHFEVLIERLQQNAAQGQDNDRDDPINLMGEEDEEVAADMNKDEDAAKSEQFEKEAQDMEADAPRVGSPAKSADDSDDDIYRWSQYKSEI